MRKKYRVFRLLLTIAMAVSFLLPQTSTVVAKEGVNGGAYVLAIVDGVQQIVSPGSIIATGELVVTDEGLEGVRLPRIRIVVVGTENHTHANVRLKITESGQLIVDKIVFDNAPMPDEGKAEVLAEPVLELSDLDVSSGASGMELDSTYHYRIYAEQDYNDFLGWDITTVKAAMSYYDNGSSVWGGHDWFYDGWINPWFPWWERLSLGSGWDPYGYDGSVHINCDASFASPGEGGILFYWHWQKIQVNATPGFWYYWSEFEGIYVYFGWVDMNGWRVLV